VLGGPVLGNTDDVDGFAVNGSAVVSLTPPPDSRDRTDVHAEEISSANLESAGPPPPFVRAVLPDIRTP
jgi:hypothetical protein